MHTYAKRKWRAYPPPVKTRSGCKVSWNYYRTKAEAERCSKAAALNASIAMDEGFDFGYCAPGEITLIPADSKGYFEGDRGNGPEWFACAGLYEVCLP